MTTFTVTSENNAGIGSLREGINQANLGIVSRIIFQLPPFGGQTIFIDTPLNIQNNINIILYFYRYTFKHTE